MSDAESSNKSFTLEDKFPHKQRGTKTTIEDRKNYIDFMFEHYNDIKAKSRSEFTKKLLALYEDETGIRIAFDWAYRLMRLYPTKHRDGSYTFKNYAEHTMEELCETPSLVSTIRFTK